MRQKKIDKKPYHTATAKFPTTSPQLPVDFASQVWDEEMELKRNCSMEQIMKLIELYTEAVEFYEYNQDKKYILFKEKIQDLFQMVERFGKESTSPPPPKLPSPKSSSPKHDPLPPPSPQDSPEKSPKHPPEQNKALQALQTHSAFDFEMPTKVAKKVDKLVDCQEDESTTASHSVIDDLKSQNISMEKKLASRILNHSKLYPDSPKWGCSRINMTFCSNNTDSSFIFSMEEMLKENEQMEKQKGDAKANSDTSSRRSSIRKSSSEMAMVFEAISNAGKEAERKTSLSQELEERQEELEKIAKIREEYETQISEFEAQRDLSVSAGPNDIMGKVIENLRKELEGKIKEIEAEFRAKREIPNLS